MLDQKFYNYDPSVAAAIVFAVLYGITCVTTIFLYFWYRCWFWIFVVIASLMETVGYCTRVFSAKHIHNKPEFIVQFLTILLAPPVLAASCYMAMGRVVLHVTPKQYCNRRSLWVTPRFMTPVFVAFDVIAFFIQVIGAASTVSSSISTQKRGYTILKIGLIVQLLAFGFFLVISFRFHMFSKRFRDSWPDTRWKTFLWAINVSCTLIFIRSVYRFVEFALGLNGYLTDHEWNFYVFDAGTILPVFIIFLFYHPAKYLTRVEWKQTTERKMPSRQRIGTSDETELT